MEYVTLTPSKVFKIHMLTSSKWASASTSLLAKIWVFNCTTSNTTGRGSYMNWGYKKLWLIMAPAPTHSKVQMRSSTASMGSVKHLISWSAALIALHMPPTSTLLTLPEKQPISIQAAFACSNSTPAIPSNAI